MPAGDVHRDRRNAMDRLDELGLQVRRDARRRSQGPSSGCRAARRRSTRPRRSRSGQPGQQPELVEPSQRPDMEQHRPRAAAREAQPGRARFGRSLLVAWDEVDGPRGGVAGDLDVVRAAPRRVVDHRIPLPNHRSPFTLTRSSQRRRHPDEVNPRSPRDTEEGRSSCGTTVDVSSQACSRSVRSARVSSFRPPRSPRRRRRPRAPRPTCPDTHWPLSVQGRPLQLHAGLEGRRLHLARQPRAGTSG